MLTLFFFYRDGESIAQQSQSVIRRFFGERVFPYIRTGGEITRAVLHGLLITAFAQGLMAGVGYRIVGLQGPILLGVLTGALSAVPVVGTAVVFVPLGVWLLLTGPPWQGVVLLLWCFLLVQRWSSGANGQVSAPTVWPTTGARAKRRSRRAGLRNPTHSLRVTTDRTAGRRRAASA